MKSNTTKILKILGNQYRYRIMELLIHGEKNVELLNSRIKISQAALSQHLGALRIAGLVETRRDQRRIYYSVKNPNVKRLIELMQEW